MSSEGPSPPSRAERLHQALDHAAHVLPQQGPIGVFVHHNTLHAFEHLPFEQAVIDAWHLFGAEPYMSEAAYREELARGRIRLEDIDAVLEGERGGSEEIFPGLSRHSLRRAM
ncbi:MAG TPA: putative inorganic carbon transporter subunit DabA, partial [Bryobacteraceae bacterium]